MAELNLSALSRLDARLRPLALALPVVGALFAGMSSASATTYQYSSVSVTNEEGIHILTPNNVSGGMGQITLHGAGADLNNDLNVWCLDIYTFLAGSDTFNQVTLTNTGAGSPNPTLTNGQIQEIGGLVNHATPAFVASAHGSAATQLAIWIIEYGVANFTYTGVGAATIALANSLIADLGSTIPYVTPVTLLTDAPGTDHNQQLAYILAGSSITPTPLPATWTMLVGGMTGFGYLVRRNKKRKALAAA